ncbi:hypothetical protein J3R83DRAFT_7219 [Lanmaoa asiatica]|nr:hypothetical protein J3R83DRAFT_7219 [Lanmaoa asiatica]
MYGRGALPSFKSGSERRVPRAIESRWSMRSENRVDKRGDRRKRGEMANSARIRACAGKSQPATSDKLQLLDCSSILFGYHIDFLHSGVYPSRRPFERWDSWNTLHLVFRGPRLNSRLITELRGRICWKEHSTHNWETIASHAVLPSGVVNAKPAALAEKGKASPDPNSGSPRVINPATRRDPSLDASQRGPLEPEGSPSRIWVLKSCKVAKYQVATLAFTAKMSSPELERAGRTLLFSHWPMSV